MRGRLCAARICDLRHRGFANHRESLSEATLCTRHRPALYQKQLLKLPCGPFFSLVIIENLLSLFLLFLFLYLGDKNTWPGGEPSGLMLRNPCPRHSHLSHSISPHLWYMTWPGRNGVFGKNWKDPLPPRKARGGLQLITWKPRGRGWLAAVIGQAT